VRVVHGRGVHAERHSHSVHLAHEPSHGSRGRHQLVVLAGFPFCVKKCSGCRQLHRRRCHAVGREHSTTKELGEGDSGVVARR